MFSPELTKFIIKYQSNDFLPEKKEAKTIELKNNKLALYSQFVTVPVEIKD